MFFAEINVSSRGTRLYVYQVQSAQFIAQKDAIAFGDYSSGLWSGYAESLYLGEVAQQIGIINN
jgi:hypothetical protein